MKIINQFKRLQKSSKIKLRYQQHTTNLFCGIGNLDFGVEIKISKGKVVKKKSKVEESPEKVSNYLTDNVPGGTLGSPKDIFEVTVKNRNGNSGRHRRNLMAHQNIFYQGRYLPFLLEDWIEMLVEKLDDSEAKKSSISNLILYSSTLIGDFA